MTCRTFSLALFLALLFSFASPASAADPLSLADRLGRLPSELIQEKKTDAEIVEALFRSTLARAPEKLEQGRGMKHLKGAVNREEASQDMLWALVNSKEFMALHGINGQKAMDDFNDKMTKAMKKK